MVVGLPTAYEFGNSLKTRSVLPPEMAKMGEQRLDLLRAAMMVDLGGGWAATAYEFGNSLKTRSVLPPEMAEMGEQRLDLLRAAMMVDLGGGWAATALKTRSVLPPEMAEIGKTTLGPAESCYDGGFGWWLGCHCLENQECGAA